MKRIFFVLTVVFLLFSSFASATTRQKPTTTVYTSSTLVKRGDALIYRIEYIVTSAGGGWAIYDDTGTGFQTQANIKTEGSEASANDGDVYDFTTLRNGGLELSTGLNLYINNASVVITYD